MTSCPPSTTGVIRPRDDTPLVCRGCRVRGTWRNAGFCCTICYKSYGRHHGYYCAQEVVCDINTKLHRAIDVINPSIRWEQDYVDDMGWDTATERSVHPHPPTIPWRTRTILSLEIPILNTEVPICDTGASTDIRSTAWSHGVLGSQRGCDRVDIPDPRAE